MDIVKTLLKIISSEDNNLILIQGQRVSASGFRRWGLIPRLNLIPLISVDIINEYIIFPGFSIVATEEIDHFIVDKGGC